MQCLGTWTGTQAVAGACQNYSGRMSRALFAIMRQDPWDRMDIRNLARVVGHEYKLCEEGSF